LSRIGIRAQLSLWQQQYTLWNAVLNVAFGQWQALASARKPGELLKQQVGTVAELGEQLIASAQQTMDIQAELRDELIRFLQNGFDILHPPLLSSGRES
jgi:phasin family protein